VLLVNGVVMTSHSQQRRQQNYSDGSTYDGEWNSMGERHGRGSVTYGNNTCYTGQFEHGLQNGCGVMIIPDTSDRCVASA